MRTNIARIVSTAALTGIVLASGACSKHSQTSGAESESQLAAQPNESAAPGGQSTDWVKEPAASQGVKVKLPDTPMTDAATQGAK